MEDERQWVALLTEDEDDFAYWQFGFKSWANHLRIEWFATGEAFFLRPNLIQAKPSVLLLDGLIPSNEEVHWLEKIISHTCCQRVSVIMLSDQFLDDQKQKYLALGAADCMVKPTNQQELQKAIQQIGGYIIS